MGQKLGSCLVTNNKVPGPGNYEAHLNNRKDACSFQPAPKYARNTFGTHGFGSSTNTRDEKIRLNVPGPGSYKLNSSIGDVPAYSMPNRSAE